MRRREAGGSDSPDEVIDVERLRESTAAAARRSFEEMAAAGHLVEAPPLYAPPAPPQPPLLVAVPDGPGERLADAERLVAENRHETALRELEGLWEHVHHAPALALRHRLAEAWALMYVGELGRAGELLEQAEMLVNSPRFEAADRGEVLFRRGALTLLRGDIAEATSLFTRALETNDRSPSPSRPLAARAHEWRSRCHQRQGSLEAALDRAHELCAHRPVDQPVVGRQRELHHLADLDPALWPTLEPGTARRAWTDEFSSLFEALR